MKLKMPQPKTSSRLRIGCDSDGVVCDLDHAWYLWYLKNHGHIEKEVMYRGWDVAKNVPVGDKVFDAWSEPGFFRNLKPYKGAVEALKTLNNNSDLYIVTSASGEPEALKDKALWYKEHTKFLDVNEQLIICHDKFIVDVDVLIDDRPSNIIDFVNFKKSRAGFLIRQRHNRDFKIPKSLQGRVTDAESLTEAVSMISELMKW